MGVLQSQRLMTGHSPAQQLYLYLKRLLQLLQLVGGEDCPVSPLLLLLLAEDAAYTPTQPRLLQLTCNQLDYI